MQHIDPDARYHTQFRRWQTNMQQRLRNLREQYDYTQQDIAECGISQRHYERMEQNPEAIISLWQLFRIAKHYDMSVSELLDTD